MTLDPFCWPVDRLGEALVALGGRTNPAPDGPPTTGAVGPWIQAAAGWIGCEAEPVETPYAEVERFLTTAAPVLVRLPGEGAARSLAVVGSRGDRVAVLTPEGRVVKLLIAEVRDALCRDVEAPHAVPVEQLLRTVVARRRERVRRELLRRLLVHARIGDCWLIRPVADNARADVRGSRLLRWLGLLLGAHLIAYGLWVLSWWVLGALAFQGRFAAGWVVAWLLLLATLIPFRLVATAAGGVLSIRAGAVIKRRLLTGALRLDPDAVRREGAGQLLGRVIESEVFETLAVSGGLLGLTALLELGLAALILGAGAGSGIHVGLLAGTLALAGALTAGCYRQRRRWTGERLELTGALVERLTGHRTRLAQQPQALWHAGEDDALHRYLGTSAALDRYGILLRVVVPRVWVVAALGALVPLFLAGHSAATLAVTVGGIVLAYRAFRDLGEGADGLATAWAAWERVGPLWRAARQTELPGDPRFAQPQPAPHACETSEPLLEARDLTFRHSDRADPLFHGASVQIRTGDRVLLLGPSGGGKSTLAALLSGGRVPSAGLLLLRGLDRATLGAEGWRRRVVLAPQFHENHVLMGTFAFNVLLGRDWPPRPADLEEAERVCRDLGLGPLLDRMPAGMQQTVGDTGWQLSHGERSRLFIARAILQRSDLVLLDESFGALDPQTLEAALRYVLHAVPTVFVISHP